MGFRQTGLAIAFAAVASASGFAQQPTATLNGDDITLRGCVMKAGNQSPRPSMLVWSRGDILLAGAAATGPAAPNPVGTSGLAGRVFYWLDDDDDIGKHVGQEVEVKGDLKDFEEGKVKIDRQGDYTEIELDLGGKEEKLRVPNAWLADEGDTTKDKEFKIVGRRIDVDNVKVIGACK